MSKNRRMIEKLDLLTSVILSLEARQIDSVMSCSACDYEAPSILIRHDDFVRLFSGKCVRCERGCGANHWSAMFDGVMVKACNDIYTEACEVTL